MSSKTLKEDEIIKYSNLKYLCLIFPLHHPRVSIWLERPWKSKVKDSGSLELHFWSQQVGTEDEAVASKYLATAISYPSTSQEGGGGENGMLPIP